MGARHHLVAVESLWREIGEHGVGGAVEDGEGVGIAGELVRVDEAAGDLVGGVGGRQ